MTVLGGDKVRPYVILRIDLELVVSQPEEAVTVKAFAVDRERADEEVARLNALGRSDRVYVHRVARGIESVLVAAEETESDF